VKCRTGSAALLWALAALPVAQGAAAPAYVSDELVLGVYAEENNQGQRLATLHSGSSVETLAQSGDFTQVRLNDGTTGWVKSAFLTTKEPATVRVKQLQEELDRSRATTPALAEAAARSEVERLKQELSAKQAQLDAALAAAPTPRGNLGTPAGPVMAGIGAALGLAGGFWLGYATLARRVRQKFGGIKVY
jgi:SH3-like domain-containing protein